LPESAPLSVTELNQLLKQSVEERFVWITVLGEASGVVLANSGHLYFNLKDATASIRVVMFRSALSRSSLKKLENGRQIIVSGSVSLYAPRGEIQIIASEIRLKGIGDIFARLEQLKKLYQEKGYFDPQRKKKLPMLPRRIGVVTSPTGAVVQDIIRVLHRRFPEIGIIIYPARVQGEGASLEIAAGVDYFNRETKKPVDVLIVGRGGGSYEDLWAFNEEPVIESIYNSRIPVISAVGHEIDFTIADFVADLRAATPSAAAEIVIGTKEEFFGRIDRLARRVVYAMESLLAQRRGTVMKALVESGLTRFPRRLLEIGQQFDNVDFSLQRFMQILVFSRTQTFNRLMAKLETLDPDRILSRGYALVTRTDHSIVREAETLKSGDRLHIRFHRGSSEAIVAQTHSGGGS